MGCYFAGFPCWSIRVSFVDRTTLIELYRYHQWANGRLRETLGTLTLEQFTRDVGGSFRSMQELLVHMVAVDWIWERRCRGESPRAFLPLSEFPDFASVESRWLDVERAQTRLIEDVTDEALRVPLAYVNVKGERWVYPLWQILLHVVNHGTYHRGQIAMLLRQLGVVPRSTDLLLLYDNG